MASGKPQTYITTFSEYTVIHVLGEGGAGYVYQVKDEEGQTFALKALKAQSITKERIKRFKNEILFCERKPHRNIVPIIEHGIFTEGAVAIPFYVMPLYDCSLRDLMDEGLQHSSIMPFFSQILDGVEAAHLQKVVHRDLKPENILCDKAQGSLVIADFGIARFLQEDLYTAVETKSSDRLANFKYAAPEQRERERDREVDHRADIYALGLILNEMFTKQIPFGTEYRTVASVSADFPYLDDLVSHMIRQSPADRPASIDSIKQDLIARGNTFVTEQKLDRLRHTVISQSEVDDPLVANPVRIVDFDWENKLLTLILSQPVNRDWVSALNNMGSHYSLLGKGPEAFSFHGDRATVRAQESDVPGIINHFKEWLPLATRKYEQVLKAALSRDQEIRQAELQAKIEEEEARARLRRSVKL